MFIFPKVLNQCSLRINKILLLMLLNWANLESIGRTSTWSIIYTRNIDGSSCNAIDSLKSRSKNIVCSCCFQLLCHRQSNAFVFLWVCIRCKYKALDLVVWWTTDNFNKKCFPADDMWWADSVYMSVSIRIKSHLIFLKSVRFISVYWLHNGSN